MKILYTTHQFYPDFGAGTELLTYMTATQMRNRGHIVKVVTGYPSKKQSEPDHAFDEYIYDNLTVNRYRHSSFHPVHNQCIMEAEHRNTVVKEWFYKLLKESKPDLVHVFHLQRLSASVLEVCCKLKIPFIITVTDFWMICPTTQLLLPDGCLCNGPQKMLENCIKHLSTKSSKAFVSDIIQKMPNKLIRGITYLLSWSPQLHFGPLANLYALTKRPKYILKQINQAKRIIVTNRFMRSMLQDNGVEQDLIMNMPFGIKRVKRIDESSRQKNETLQIGFIGTLNFHKGAHILIKAIREISIREKISLNIYGDREQFPHYVRMLDDISADDNRIVFKGTFPPERIETILSAIDVLVVPSLWYENTPLIIHQAHAVKVPVIATDLGGMNETIKDSVNGYLFPLGNVNQLSRILSSFIADRSLLEKLRDQIAPPMFIDQYATALEEQYNEIITESYRE